MKRSIHIEAPVEKVFDFVKDPKNVWDIALPMLYAVKDVKLTKEGVGTYYSWASKTPVLRTEGFDVYTEFVPNQRITDTCSWPFFGDFTYSFEPEGSGTQVTVETHHRSFWRIPPLRELVEWVDSMVTERFMSTVKAKMETPKSVPAPKRAAS